MERSKRVSLVMSSDLYDKLEAERIRLNISRSAWVNMIISKYFEEKNVIESLVKLADEIEKR